MIPMVMIQLNEDVVGTDGVWKAGESHPVGLKIAAGWIDGGVANPVIAKPQRRRRSPVEAPERAVVLPYVVPEDPSPSPKREGTATGKMFAC